MYSHNIIKAIFMGKPELKSLRTGLKSNRTEKALVKKKGYGPQTVSKPTNYSTRIIT
jgi:hypothetical protein